MTETTLSGESAYPAVFVARFINIVISIVEIALAIRVVLELFGANPTSQFVAWVYGVTGTLIGPFTGAFPSLSLGSGSVIDVVAIMAMVAYAFIGWALIELLSFTLASR